MTFTGEQVKAAMISTGIEKVDCHECSMCRYMCKYVRRGDDIFYDAGCYCTDFYRLPEPRTWEDAARWINMQTNPEIKEQIAALFGITGATQ